MCDMQNMPATDDASCEEASDMNFAFSPVGSAGTHYVTSGGQVTKLQQNVSNNGTALTQVVGMVGSEGVQYVRTMDGSTMHATPQLISVPIALPGAKPGDPQPTVQIQVLGPNLSLQQQQQPKYQMQIPIQGFQQGAVLTVAYSPEGNDSGSLQLVGQNSLEGGVQMLAAIPQQMQLMQPSQTQQDTKEHLHQVYITPQQHIIINGGEDGKPLNNNNNETIANIIIKEECDDAMQDDESQESTEATEAVPWSVSSNPEIVKYLGTLPPQQLQALPASLQQFLRLNCAAEGKKEPDVEEPSPASPKEQPVANAIIDADGNVHIQANKKKKKYKKKPPKPARPKPGQVIIATAADGTSIYCCPECHMAYPDKEQLEMHLVVHKAERRFICGICGAGLKRKEHLERHKLGHNPERPYVCGVCCKGFKRREHLNLHTVIHSGVKTEMCPLCGKGFYRKDHLRKHTRSHETKRARDEASTDEAVKPLASTNNQMPEITIHVPTSANMQVPVQINIPQHVVTSLAAAQAQQSQDDHGLEAFLANHS